jgi:hypothetical protein
MIISVTFGALGLLAVVRAVSGRLGTSPITS